MRGRTGQVTIALSLVVVGGLGGMALGLSRAGASPSGRGFVGSGPTSVAATWGRDPQVFTSVTWTDLTGAEVSVTVPGEAGYVLARFSTAFTCSNAPGDCVVRILVGDIEAKPDSAGGFRFTTSGSNGSSTMERSLGPIAPGSYRVRVQVAVTTTFTGPFTLDHWHLAVEVGQA